MMNDINDSIEILVVVSHKDEELRKKACNAAVLLFSMDGVSKNLRDDRRRPMVPRWPELRESDSKSEGLGSEMGKDGDGNAEKWSSIHGENIKLKDISLSAVFTEREAAVAQIPRKHIPSRGLPFPTTYLKGRPDVAVAVEDAEDVCTEFYPAGGILRGWWSWIGIDIDMDTRMWAREGRMGWRRGNFSGPGWAEMDMRKETGGGLRSCTHVLKFTSLVLRLEAEDPRRLSSEQMLVWSCIMTEIDASDIMVNRFAIMRQVLLVI
ncbi:hypothetical protein BDQ12DRAFT_671015 [Crucibulum laeve]|uniref:Uncharacterized protein n=1 Tax=Crucibulum laeve TaxID=68775 RepID=A0A5C3LIA9_9AGAR|nr:hypothetical protein BDQ12DRAFT_671015 [Crucibulum laeve]